MNKKKILLPLLAIAALCLAVAVIFTSTGIFAEDAASKKGDYTVTLCQTADGSIHFASSDKDTGFFDEGNIVTVESTPDNGCYVTDISVMAEDGSILDYEEKDDNITFTMPGQNVYVSFIFEGNTTATEEVKTLTGNVYKSSDFSITYKKASGEKNDTAQAVQDEINQLPDIEGYKKLDSEEQESMKSYMEGLYEEYMSLSDNERRTIDPSRLFTTYLYSESLIYMPDEGTIDLVNVPDTVTLSGQEKSDFAEDLKNLPALHSVTDVNSVVLDASGELTGNHICYSDENAETFISHDEVDSLFDEVLRLSELYVTADPDQAGSYDYSRLQFLMYYFTTGVNAYPRDEGEETVAMKILGIENAYAASSVGSITGYYTVRYSGDLATNSPRGGVYTVATQGTNWKRVNAFCMNSQMNTPGGVNTNLTYENVLTNDVVKVILYYGYGGPGEIVSHDNNGYLETHFAIDWAVNGTSSSRNLALAAYNKLYTNVDKSVADKVHGYIAGTGSSSAQQLVYVSYYSTSENPVYMTTNYTARDAVYPMLDLFIEKTDAETGENLQGAEFEIYMDGSKVATVTSDENGQASYHYRGNTLWTSYQTSATRTYCVNYDNLSAADKNNINNNGSIYNYHYDAYMACKNEAISRVNSAKASLKSGTTHTWRVIETKAPEWYILNEKVWEQRVDLNTNAIEVDFSNLPDTAPVYVQKYSGNTSLTDGNDCYSLAGAKYAVYKTRDDALNDTNRFAVITTDETGKTEEVELQRGTWYLKEVEAPEGYLLCTGTLDHTQDGIHTVEITDLNITYKVDCTDPPADDPFNLILNKLDYDTDGEAQGIASTGGAIFEVTYFQNINADVSDNPDNTWYFTTDEDGYLNCQNNRYYLDSYTMNDGSVLQSDDLYTDDGSVIYPIGTYLIKEVSPPKYYQLSGTMNFIEYPDNKVDITEGLKLVIKQTENGADPKRYDGNDPVNGVISAENFTINVYDQVRLGSITIYKEKADGTKEPLSGVTFKLKGIEEGDEQTLTTNENGVISFGNLIPQNYVITEIKTQSGFSLLKDNINAVLPVEMSLDEIDEYGADIGKAIFDEVSQKYCFYDISFTVGDSVTFDMPFTGGNEIPVVIIVIGSAVILSGVLLFAGKKKKMRAHQD